MNGVNLNLNSNLNWTDFSNMFMTEYETQRLLRETLNAPMPFKYVLDPSSSNVVSEITFSQSSVNENNYSDSCPITMDAFTEGEIISKLPCGHIFKTNALDNWLHNEKAECPVCRYKLPCIEVRNTDYIIEPPIEENREREDIDRNIFTLLSSLQSLDNIYSRNRFY